MASDITKGHMQLTIYQTGLMYAILKECRVISESRQADQALMSDIHIQFEASFEIIAEQKVLFYYLFLYLYADCLDEYPSCCWGVAP